MNLPLTSRNTEIDDELGDSFVNITIAKNVSTDYEVDDSQGGDSVLLNHSSQQSEQGSYYKHTTRPSNRQLV